MQWPARKVAYLLACTGLVLAALVRLALLEENLPVALNVDERTGLRVLGRFHDGSYNPDFFHYPTFYYYLTFFFSKITGGFEYIIANGRRLNIAYSIGLAVFAGLLAARLNRSPLVWVSAALFCAFSPIIITNSQYIITEPLYSLLIMASLLNFAVYATNGSLKHWLAAWVICGIAVSTKYTVGILVIAYCLHGLLLTPPPTQNRGRLLAGIGRLVPRWFVLGLLATAGAAAIGVFFFWPQETLIRLISIEGGGLANVDAADIAFLDAMRARVGALALVAFACTLAVFFSQGVSRRFQDNRLYTGPAIALLVFSATSPFILLNPIQFLYDFGAEAKATLMASPHSMWTYYFDVYFNWESLVVLGLCGIGIASGVWRNPAARPALFFLALYIFTIGSAHRGFVRYLMPALPIVAVFAGVGLAFLYKQLSKWSIPALTVMMVMIFGAWGIENAMRLGPIINAADEKDEMHASYTALKRMGVDRVVLIGYGPDFELQREGVIVQRMPAIHNSVPKHSGDFLLVDSRRKKLLENALSSYDFSLVWHDSRNYGQFLYRRN